MTDQELEAHLQNIGPIKGLRPESLLVVWTLFGDALRREDQVFIPPAFRQKLAELSIDTIQQCLMALRAEAVRWALPTVLTEDDHYLAWAIRRRDEVESCIMGIRRTLIQRDLFDEDIREMGYLTKTLESIDMTCGGNVTRAQALRALEDRITFQTSGCGGDWVRLFPE